MRVSDTAHRLTGPFTPSREGTEVKRSLAGLLALPGFRRSSRSPDANSDHSCRKPDSLWNRGTTVAGQLPIGRVPEVRVSRFTEFPFHPPNAQTSRRTPESNGKEQDSIECRGRPLPASGCILRTEGRLFLTAVPGFPQQVGADTPPVLLRPPGNPA